jgi:hypothetical protein
MGKIILNTGAQIDGGFEVAKVDTSTDCSTLYEYTITSVDGDLVNITLNGDHENASYTLNGVTVNFTDSVSGIVYNTSLIVNFSIQNSGESGVFKSSLVNITNTTQSLSYDDIAERENDSPVCGAVITYDDLDDTPENKTGSALKLVRVNAGEDGHEYVDPGDLGVDLNWTHVQAVPSDTWIINHNKGKIFSVTVIDDLGNRVHGDVDYSAGVNSLTINFNTAFSGTAYLN